VGSITPVNWYQTTSPLKLMMDRLVCADGGNPDPTTTPGKDAAKAKAIELAGSYYPKHLAGRLFAIVVHGDAEGIVEVKRALSDWLTSMDLESAGAYTHGQPGYSKNKNAASEMNMNHKNFDASSLVVAFRRLDLDWRWHEAALRLGCVMSINPDGNRPHALGRGNGPQRRVAERQGLELPRQGRVVGLSEKAPGETSDQGRLSRRRMLRPPASSSAPKQADARKPRGSARR
jgi:hypothetical protein